ncbi:regulatory protein, luxR family [Streptacidiphilus jiangxiensis]|uniref:Regulatory protein, luxR family n=1 Tax=Streptacidiphilus jiangxiensis TaxID=235985 RepID=A0A1H7QT37_STRJI|nr:regulatory protein, luxR family [Streptacidiphilus jiangxiensis]
MVCGRDAELEVLRGALDEASAGRGGLVWLVGRPGIGKTRLARELAGLADGRHVPVTVGRAAPEGANVPFLPLTQALLPVLDRGPAPTVAEAETWQAALAAVLPDANGKAVSAVAGGEISAPVRAAALTRLVRRLAEPLGLLVVLEDLHWVDPDTLAVLDLLADTERGGRALWLLTARDGEGAAADLARRCHDRRGVDATVALDRLGDEDVARMARACDPQVDDDRLTRVCRGAEGVPFLVEELLAGPGVPESFAATVRARTARLAPSTRLVLNAAAVLGRRFDWELLPRITALPRETVSASLAEGTACGLLAVNGAAFEFRHALTRDALLADLLPPAREPLAAAALAALTEAHPDLGAHWRDLAAELASQAGDVARAGALLAQSGRAALDRGALDTAVGTLRAARALLVDTGQGADTGRLLVRALALAGRVDETVEAGEQLLLQLGPDRESAALLAEVTLTVAGALVAAARSGEAGRWLELSVPAREEAGEPAWDARAGVLASELALAADDTVTARQLAGAALDSGHAAPETACQAHEVLGRIDRPVDLEAARCSFQEALTVATVARLPLWRLRALHELGTIELYRTAGTRQLEQAHRTAVELGALGTAAVLDIQICAGLQSRFERGRADLHARRALDLSERLGLSAIHAAALYFLAEIRAFRCERDEMERYLTLLAGSAPVEPELEAGAWAGCRGMLALFTGAWSEAVAAMDRGMALLRPLPRANPAEYRAIWPLLLAALDDPRAPGALDEALRSDVRVGFANRGLLGYAEAVLCGRAGAVGRAEELVHTADAALDGFPVWGDLARLLAVDRARSDGWGRPEEWLHAGESTFTRLGMPGLAAHGAPPAHPAAPGATEREREVLDLLTTGLSNKEIAARLRLSPRTVEKHVEGLLRKSGARSRTQLVARGLGGPGGGNT